MRNYYDILGVSKSASADDIRKAYKKLAIKHHPDKNGGSEEAKRLFQEISEAYEVLSDDEKRKIFDMYGEAGLKGEVPVGGGGGAEGDIPFTFRKSAGGSPNVYHFTSHDPSEIFKQFFGTNNPFEAENGGGDDASPFGGFSSFFGGGRRGGMNGRRAYASSSPFGDISNEFHGVSGMPRPPKRCRPIEQEFMCTLEELYNGVTKKMAVTRTITDEDGTTRTEKKVLEIPVKPGFKEGTKITFAEAGDQAPGIVPADIIFKLKEKPHAIFKREGDNLVMNAKVTLEEALTGTTKVLVQTLNNRKFYVKVPHVITPQYVHVLKNEGMPKSKESGKFGDLLINFNIEFPKSLTQTQKNSVAEALKGVAY